jgi:hypothetical protein
MKSQEQEEKLDRLRQSMTATAKEVGAYSRQIETVSTGMSRLIRRLDAIEERLNQSRKATGGDRKQETAATAREKALESILNDAKDELNRQKPSHEKEPIAPSPYSKSFAL